ncbi:zinc finger, CCHC-type containing protein [Tanacetum coccineum]
MVNSMLSYSGLSQGFWGEAMLTACYLLNRVPNKRNMITPYELWTKKKPNLNYLRVWGCRAVVRLPDPKLKTLGERGIECIFVGYAEHSKAFRFYVIEPNDSVSINSIIESRDAIFDENRFSSVPRPSLRIPNGTEEIGGTREEDIAFWKEAINDEMDSIMGNNTWVLADLPPGCKLFGCKWAFKRKLKVDGTIENFKARLVIQGFKQKSEINYFDTYAPVAVSVLKTADCLWHNLHLDNQSDGSSDLTKEFLLSMVLYEDIGEALITPMDTYCMTFAVGKLSMYTSNPSTHYWQSIQRVLKYLKKTMDYRLTYTGYPLVLEGYTDASWISNNEDNSSTSGGVFLLGKKVFREFGGGLIWDLLEIKLEQISQRHLFGGVISTNFPLRFEDVSNIHEVPDHQEVFVDHACDESLMVEILELKDDVVNNGSEVKVSSWFLNEPTFIKLTDTLFHWQHAGFPSSAKIDGSTQYSSKKDARTQTIEKKAFDSSKQIAIDAPTDAVSSYKKQHNGLESYT